MNTEQKTIVMYNRKWCKDTGLRCICFKIAYIFFPFILMNYFFLDGGAKRLYFDLAKI